MKKLLYNLCVFEKTLSIISLSSIFILILIDVLGREFFGRGIPFAQKLSSHAMIWMGFLGTILVSVQSSPVQPEIAKKIQLNLKRISVFFTACFCLLFGILAVQYVKESFVLGDKNVITGLPLWVVQMIIPYTFFSLCLRYFVFSFIGGFAERK